MTRLLAPLGLALIAPHALAQVNPLPPVNPPAREYLEGGVLPIGWPAGRPAGVVDLCALRFSNEFELDAAFRVGDEVILIHHPARYEAYYSLGTGTRALAVLPVATGLDGALVVDDRGLVLKEWDPEASPSSFVLERVAATGWSNVDELWVFPEDGKYRIYGNDPVGSGNGPELLGLEYDAERDVPLDDPWSTLAPYALPSPLRDLLFLEYDDAYPGEERLWLFGDGLIMTDNDGSSYILSSGASASDQVAHVATDGFTYSTPEGPRFYVEPDLLLWVTPLPVQPMLLSGNGSSQTGPPPYTLLNSVTKMIVVDLDGDGNDEVVGAEDTGSVATLLWRDSSMPWNPFNPTAPLAPFGNADTLDTLELAHGLSSRPRIDDMVAGDFDLDGDADLLYAHAGTQELRLWLNTYSLGHNERTRLRSEQEELEVTSPGAGVSRVPLEMVRNTGAGFSHWQVEVWIDPSYANDQDQLILHESRIYKDEGIEVQYSFDYEPTADGISADHVCWIVFTGLDYDEVSGETLGRHSSRMIYYAPDPDVEDQLATAHYPHAEHVSTGFSSGNSSGLRSGSRVNGGGSTSPPPE